MAYQWVRESVEEEVSCPFSNISTPETVTHPLEEDQNDSRQKMQGFLHDAKNGLWEKAQGIFQYKLTCQITETEMTELINCACQQHQWMFVNDAVKFLPRLGIDHKIDILNKLLAVMNQPHGVDETRVNVRLAINIVQQMGIAVSKNHPIKDFLLVSARNRKDMVSIYALMVFYSNNYTPQQQSEVVLEISNWEVQVGNGTSLWSIMLVETGMGRDVLTQVLKNAVANKSWGSVRELARKIPIQDLPMETKVQCIRTLLMNSETFHCGFRHANSIINELAVALPQSTENIIYFFIDILRQNVFPLDYKWTLLLKYAAQFGFLRPILYDYVHFQMDLCEICDVISVARKLPEELRNTLKETEILSEEQMTQMKVLKKFAWNE